MSDDLELAEFEWDTANVRHILIDSPHGITPERCNRLRDDAPRIFPARQGPGRSASHMVVARDEDERFWTLIVDFRGRGLWRPITGWPSTRSEIRLYNEVDNA